jgi:hypothetical protein
MWIWFLWKEGMAHAANERAYNSQTELSRKAIGEVENIQSESAQARSNLLALGRSARIWRGMVAVLQQVLEGG